MFHTELPVRPPISGSLAVNCTFFNLLKSSLYICFFVATLLLLSFIALAFFHALQDFNKLKYLFSNFHAFFVIRIYYFYSTFFLSLHKTLFLSLWKHATWH